jgi:DNA ligase-1
MRLTWPTLGKIDARNKLHTWVVEYDDKNKCLNMTLGCYGGKMRTLTAPIVCKSKNTFLDQAMVDGHTRWREKLYDGYQRVYLFIDQEPPWSLELRKQVMETLKEQDSRQLYVAPNGRLFEPMLAYEHNTVKEIEYPCYVQPKLDGERMVSKLDGDTLKCQSRHTTKITFLEHIKEGIQKLLNQLPEGVILDGELYTHGMTFSKISERVRRSTDVHPDEGVIEYHIFDIFNPHDPSSDYATRMALINNIDIEAPLCIVPTHVAESYEDILTYLDEFTNDGYEGVMLRKCEQEYVFGRTKGLLKVKKFNDEEGEIIGAQEATGTQKGMVMWIVRDPRGNEFAVQPCGDFKQRTEHYDNREQYLGRKLKYKYQELSEYGVPRFAKGIAII